MFAAPPGLTVMASAEAIAVNAVKANTVLARNVVILPMVFPPLERFILISAGHVAGIDFSPQRLRHCGLVCPRLCDGGFLLQRLRKYLAHHRGTEQPQVQQVALSATITDPARTATVYLGEQAQVIALPGQREIDARVVQVYGDDIARARQTMEAIAAKDAA